MASHCRHPQTRENWNYGAYIQPFYAFRDWLSWPVTGAYHGKFQAIDKFESHQTRKPRPRRIAISVY